MAEYNETALLEAIKQAKEMPSNAVATTKKFKGMEYQDVPGYPYIFEEGKFSAFGPQQIQTDLVTDVKNNLSSLMNAEDVPEGFTEYLSQLEYDTKMKRNAGLGYSRIKDDAGKLIKIDKSKYGPLLQGSISTEQHQQFYPLLASLGLKRKIQLIPEGQEINVENIARAWHSNPNQTLSEQYGVAVREEYEKIIGADIKPDVKPTPDYTPVEPETKQQTEEVFTLDYPGELPDIGEDDIPMEESTDMDIVSEGTDEDSAINKILRGESAVEDIESKADEFPEKKSWLQRLLGYNEGGAVMEKQMEMFEDGGLMDEGGTVDPVSGNDVPPGSTQEEVRDDIPAQLSEGEFVFPADVVRYWGLEKLMQMRQEAKAGLARMEAMGQMGNADEATLPDDIPFDLDDLDMEDEPMEFQQGGLVPNPYGVYQQPSQFATYGQQPYQVPQMPVAPVAPQVPLQTGFTPVTTPVTPTAPTFEELLPTTTGKYDELREYVNSETGESMTIPFVDGKPIYPIPTGFTPKPTEQVEAAVPEDTVVPTATVQKEEGDGRVTGPEYATTDVTGIGYDRSQLTPALRETISEYGFGFGALAEVAGKTNVANVIGELMGKDPKVAAKNLTSSAFGGVLDAFRGGEVSFSNPNRMGMKTGKYNDNTPLHEMSATKQIDIATVADRVMKDMQGVFTDEKGKPKTTAEATRSMKALADSLGVSTTVEGTNLTKSLTTIMREVSKQKGIQVKAQLEKEKAEAERQRAAQQAANTAAAIIAAQQNKDDNADPKSKGPGGTGYGSGNQGISHAGGGAGGRFGPSGGFAEGGLASKPKPKKTKKMKRGGLASK
jgi:hypothetical protein